MSNLINKKELAVQLGISEKTVNAWVSTRRIPYIKLGRAVRFDQKDIDKFIESRKIRAALQR